MDSPHENEIPVQEKSEKSDFNRFFVFHIRHEKLCDFLYTNIFFIKNCRQY